MVALVMALPTPALPACDVWPEWRSYKAALLDDGRIVDLNTPARITTSEGQAYGLFFALVANDRAGFDRLLTWTENNLAQGDLTAHLPAWQWGLRPDGRWDVMDDNPASDADVWLAYVLGQAGRLWNDRHLQTLSRVIARRILAQETVPIPGLGLSLLPAPVGFQTADDAWRLNPSYVPIQILRALAAIDSRSPWPDLIEASVRLIRGSAPAGFAPDWIGVRAEEGLQPIPKMIGSYDAIRVYLWAGMLHPAEPHREGLLMALKPMAQATAQRGAPPEMIDIAAVALQGDGPVGFSAAVLPLLVAAGETAAAERQLARITAHPPASTAYYDRSLVLFGLGWHQGYFRFAENGMLQPRWKKACARSLH